MQRVGVLEFTFKGQSLSLGAFVEEGAREIDGLFVPFVDATSGKETYPAGRYLDIPPTTTGFYEIDFNRPTTRTAPTTRRTSVRIRRHRTG